MQPARRITPTPNVALPANGVASVSCGQRFGDLALRLFENGYEPLPIRPGTKRPAPSRWSNVAIDLDAVARWSEQYPDSGIGLRTGQLVGLDIDALDGDDAWALMDKAHAQFGTTLLRVGQWPKRMLLYRCSEPFRKLKQAPVEVLGLGQQFVAFGIHPGTQAPYDWPLGESPADVPLDELPMVDEAGMAAYLASLPGARQAPVARASSNVRPKLPQSQSEHAISRDAQGRVVDGRDGWLSAIAYHTVLDAVGAGLTPVREQLASITWARFAETTDLTRPRSGGAQDYTIGDALKKVSDKLRLLAVGSLPLRERAKVVPDYELPTLPVQEARAQLDTTLSGFCADVLGWDDRGGVPPPRLAIRATVGLGKSTATRHHLEGLRRALMAQGRPHRIVVFVQSHALAEQAADDWRQTGFTVAVLRGYERKDAASGRPMCQRFGAVRVALANKHDIYQTLCYQSQTCHCRFHNSCAKMQNRRDVANAEIVIAPYDAMFQGFYGGHDGIGLIVIDESCWSRAIETTAELDCSDLLNGMLTGFRGNPQRRASNSADLMELRRKLHTCLAQCQPGLIEPGWLEAVGIDADACRLAAELESARLSNPRLSPDLGVEAERAAIGCSIGDAVVHGWIELWTALGERFSGAKNVHIHIGALDPHNGAQPLLVQRLKPLAPVYSELPCLHLDATLRTELVAPILPDLQAVSISASAPHMHVHVINGGFSKTKLALGTTGNCPGPLLSDCMDFVRWRALQAKTQGVLVVTHKQFESMFRSIPGVEVAHFNAIAGIDLWNSVRTLIVVGRPMPRTSDLVYLAGTLFGAKLSGRYCHTDVGLHGQNGQVHGLNVLRHSDQEGELLRAAICDDELIQVIGRGRGINRDECTPLDVFLLADVALPLAHDSIMPWSMARPDCFKKMLLEGVAVDSPKDAAALFPALFSSQDQTKKLFRAGLAATPSLRRSLEGATLKSARYRRGGRGAGWQTATWETDIVKDPREWLERRIGQLADWEPERR